jgi:Tfp pilus assembly protein PilF
MVINSYKKWIESFKSYFDPKRYMIMNEYGDFLFSKGFYENAII